jgi:hypothetical protein
MPDPNLGQIISTVWEGQVGNKPNDNIFNSRAFFYSLAGGGQKGLKGGVGFEGREALAGGRNFDFTLEYAVNPNFRSYGEFENLDTTRTDVFDAARYDWKISAGTIIFSDLEELRAQGSAGKIDLIASKLENGKNSHIADMNTQLLGTGAGNGGKDMNGLQNIISATPTTGTVGGINRANFAFWRNKQTSGAQTTSAFDNLRAAMRSIYNQCSLGGVIAAPTAALTNRTVFEGYESLLIANERFTTDDKQNDGHGAFQNAALKFKGATLFYDEDLSLSSCYFYNPKYLKLIYLKGAWMKMKEKVEPSNQLSMVYRLYTIANLGTNNSRHCGVVNAIT